MATGRFACTFSATPGPSFGGWTSTSSQSGCCLTTQGLIQTAYGINPTTCNVIVWVGNGAPYDITQLAANSGSFDFTDASCSTFIDKVLNGVTQPGDGHSPNNKGSASQYGFSGCSSTTTSSHSITTPSPTPSTSSSKAAGPTMIASSQIAISGLLLANLLLVNV